MFTTYTKEDLDSSKSEIKNLINTPEDELVEKYQLEKCISWVKEHNYERTCLQFPENLLNDGVSIAVHLQKCLGKTFYILADTSYGSCCVDEIAAEHINGDSIIHFGHACLSPVNKLPVLYIFEKKHLDLTKLRNEFQVLDGDQVVIFFSDVFHHLHSELCCMFEGCPHVLISRLQIDNTPTKLEEKVLSGRVFVKDSNLATAVYIGEDSITLQNLVLGLSDLKWYRYTEDEKLVEFNLNRSKFLMQRSHLVEKIKEANIIGILIGTLSIKNYLDAVERIKLLVKNKGKKCYMLAVGKPNVAKLANFPEIDVFVCISCQENSLLKCCKEYHKPVVSLFEVELALGDRPYSVEYTSDFRDLLPGGILHIETNPEVSLNSDKISQELMERHSGTIIESSGAQFLSNRTWRGLEQNLGETEITKAVRGRTGIPQTYENEVTTLAEETRDKSA